MDPRIGWLWPAPFEDGRGSPTELLARALLVVLVALVPILIFLPGGVRRHRFWCALQGREVEVEFEEHGPPGLRQAVGVKRCSAFDPPTAVACERRCLDDGVRRQWLPALPVDTRAGG